MHKYSHKRLKNIKGHDDLWLPKYSNVILLDQLIIFLDLAKDYLLYLNNSYSTIDLCMACFVKIYFLNLKTKKNKS